MNLKNEVKGKVQKDMNTKKTLKMFSWLPSCLGKLMIWIMEKKEMKNEFYFQDPKYWPAGFGQLTPKGKMMQVKTIMMQGYNQKFLIF